MSVRAHRVIKIETAGDSFNMSVAIPYKSGIYSNGIFYERYGVFWSKIVAIPYKSGIYSN